MPTIETPEEGLVSVRAKFIVTKAEYFNPISRLIVMHPVFSQDPNHKNKWFWDATPSGELTMTINNPRAAEFFVVGREYYVDFVNPPKMADLTAREEIGRLNGSMASSSSTTLTLPSVTTP